MNKYLVAIMEGDGIGPEISKVAVDVLETLNELFDLGISLQNVEGGDGALKNFGKALPPYTVEVLKNCHACLKAPVGESAADVIVKLRQIFDLYANVRPARVFPNVRALKPNIDLVIVRENTEDVYKGVELDLGDAVVALRPITKKACERIAEYAFNLAKTRAKRKVTAVHKANVLRKSDGLFLETCRRVAKRYQDINFDDMLVDAAAMSLIRDPERFDVIVTTNLYGDILSDEASQVVGGLGLAPSANIGENFAIFEPVHGSAPDIAGKGIANPLGMVLSVSMMLDWFFTRFSDQNSKSASEVLVSAVYSILKKGVKTPDLGGNYTTNQVGEELKRELIRLSKPM